MEAQRRLEVETHETEWRSWRVAWDLDQQLASSTGRSSEAWLNEGARLIKAHPWKAVTAMAVVAFVLGKLRG